MGLAGSGPLNSREVDRWDFESDVVIVGSGCAGLSAAIEAGSAGASVAVLERAGGAGGASAMAGGILYLGGGTPLQHACGFDDDPDEMYKFLLAVSPGSDKEKVATYCEGSLEHFAWLVACGVPFKETFYAGLLSEPPGDEGLMYSGAENSYPWCEIARPAPRGHVPQMPGEDKVAGERGAGWMLIQCLASAATQRGANLKYDIRVRSLIVDDDGAVVGVAARSFGEDLTCSRIWRGPGRGWVRLQ